jgi:hypothetical protein
MIDCRFKPIEKWPKKPTSSWNRKSRFRATWSQTLDLLERELVKLRAKEIVVEAFFHPSDIRNDGWPRANARASQPGVVLRFTTKKGVEAEFGCDRFTDWQQNLRAIALGLEALRKIDDYGIVVEEEQQYTGWLKLPAASAADEATESVKILIAHASVTLTPAQVLANQATFNSVWKEAARRTHPDTGEEGGNFNSVITARDRITQLKGW